MEAELKASAARNADGKTSSAGAESLASSSEEFVPDRVFFGFDSHEIQGQDADIERQATYIKKTSPSEVVIGGYCDERGGTEYNYSLGSQRAEALKSRLRSAGVSSKISVISYGKEVKLVDGSDEDAYSKNRVAVISIKRKD